MDQKYSTPEIENIMSNTQNQKCNDILLKVVVDDYLILIYIYFI